MKWKEKSRIGEPIIYTRGADGSCKEGLPKSGKEVTQISDRLRFRGFYEHFVPDIRQCMTLQFLTLYNEGVRIVSCEENKMRLSAIDTNRSPNIRGQSTRFEPPSPPHWLTTNHPYSKPVSHFSHRWLTYAPAEGWFALAMLAVALYSVVFSVIVADWVEHSLLLLWSPALGLLVGFVVAKTPRLPQAVLHVGACLVGHWLSVWMTSAVAFHIDWTLVLVDLRAVLTGNLSAEMMPASMIIFFFYLTFLCFFLGYFGSWLIYRAHLPWLVALVYCSIMLVNLNYGKQNFYYLAVILVGALLLLIARLHLAAQILQWTKDGLYTDYAWLRAMTLRCMRVASLLTLLVLLVSWILPIQDQPYSTALWDRLSDAWTNIFSGHGSLSNSLLSNTSGNFFGDQLTITGSVHLPKGEVLHYTTSARGMPPYLEGFTFNHFDGHTWTSSLTDADRRAFAANTPLPVGTQNGDYTPIATTVVLVQPVDSAKHYLFAPPSPASFGITSIIYTDGTAGIWTQPNPLASGDHYQVTSIPSPSDTQALSDVPLPENDSAVWQADGYYPQLMSDYVQVPRDLSQTARRLARLWTKDATDTYHALKMLETHLHGPEYTYSVDNPPIPSNVDVVDWLLQKKRGYCTYYASALAIMARVLHIPTRVVNGFSQGQLSDTQNKIWSVAGSDAHSWVQAYFPTYGWVNFEPTPGYTFNASQQPTSMATPQPTKPPVMPTASAQQRPTPARTHQPESGLKGHTSDKVIAQVNQTLLMAGSITMVLFSLILFFAALISYWWRSLYANSTLIAGMFWRLCRIASWAGLSPQSWQTPYEYSRMLSQHMPQKEIHLWRLTELFVQDRWGAPHHAPVHAAGEIEQHWSALSAMFLRLVLRRRQ